jgi:Sporulation and spore germination
MGRRVAIAGTAVAVLFFAAVAVMTKLGLAPLVRRPAAMAPAAPAPTVPAPPGRRIKARLFYVAEDGIRLTSVERDVAYGESPDEQAREIVAAQITPVVEPLVSAIPPGTTLRAVFITKSGDAYVDLSREARAAHPGGTVDELLTIYTIVNALTVNLPAVTAVQVLVDGKEVDTLSGHVDLRHPLAKNLTWVQ